MQDLIEISAIRGTGFCISSPFFSPPTPFSFLHTMNPGIVSPRNYGKPCGEGTKCITWLAKWWFLENLLVLRAPRMDCCAASTFCTSLTTLGQTLQPAFCCLLLLQKLLEGFVPRRDQQLESPVCSLEQAAGRRTCCACPFGPWKHCSCQGGTS